ncbi:MAG TPA: hypothetical protein VHW01_30165 [Polyangiaceae bacterium]|jgi:hypothetical protein|nr:hypothetical protein [Polyangiaceae bacterium]
MCHSLTSGSRVARTLTREYMLLLTGLLWFSGGCSEVATPMPEPPPDAPATGPIDITLLGPPTKGIIESTANGEAHELDGKAGSVPGLAEVRVTNLDSTEQAYSTTAFSDGHFSIEVPVVFGNELRFEWQLADARSVPADALFLEDPQAPDGFVLQSSPRFDCVMLSPGFVLDFGAAQSNTLSLQIDNQCQNELSVDAQSLRRMLPDFKPATIVPLAISVGSTATLDVTYTRSSNAAVEDTLFFDLTQSSTTIRYPVTLSADP